MIRQRARARVCACVTQVEDDIEAAVDEDEEPTPLATHTSTHTAAATQQHTQPAESDSPTSHAPQDTQAETDRALSASADAAAAPPQPAAPAADAAAGSDVEDGGSSTAASVIASDYSLSFDEVDVDLEVDASPVQTPRGAAGSQLQQPQSQRQGGDVSGEAGQSSESLAGQVAERILQDTLTDSVQVRYTHTHTLTDNQIRTHTGTRAFRCKGRASYLVCALVSCSRRPWSLWLVVPRVWPRSPLPAHQAAPQPRHSRPQPRLQPRSQRSPLQRRLNLAHCLLSAQVMGQGTRAGCIRIIRLLVMTVMGSDPHNTSLRTI